DLSNCAKDLFVEATQASELCSSSGSSTATLPHAPFLYLPRLVPGGSSTHHEQCQKHLRYRRHTRPKGSGLHLPPSPTPRKPATQNVGQKVSKVGHRGGIS